MSKRKKMQTLNERIENEANVIFYWMDKVYVLRFGLWPITVMQLNFSRS